MKTRLFCGLLLLGALLLPTGLQARQRVMVLAEPGGQHEAFTLRGLDWLRQQAQVMDFELTEVSNCTRIAAGDIGRYDAVVQLNYPPYMWSQDGMAEFERAIDEGTVAWVGFHHASLLGEFDGFPMWGWFSDFLGSIRFQNYIAAKADGTVTVEDTGHPVMNGVSPQFVIREDEWYTYDRNPRPNVHVLASVDENSYVPASDIRMGDHPVIWTNPRKAARNVYFQIGHSASLFDNPDFVRMFLNSLCWALGRPMPLVGERSLESQAAAKRVLASEPLPAKGWQHEGLGRAVSADGMLLMAMPLSTGRRATGAQGDPDYALYGSCTARLPMGGKNLERYNRLSFDIRSDLDAGVANMNVALEGDPYPQLGAHLVNMQGGGEWQHVSYEIDELPRSKVYALRFYTDLKGRNLSRHDSVRYYIRNLKLERVATPEQVSGWQPVKGRLAYSMSGYLTQGAKTAVAADGAGAATFRLVDERTGLTAYEASVSRTTTTVGSFTTLDFSDFRQPGVYRLVSGKLRTEPFPIGDDIMRGSEWKVLNYIHAQRCGDEVGGIHGRCHVDVFCDHDGRSFTYGGGWHDAGDLSQQTLQTGYVAYALLEAADALTATDAPLAETLRQEARHGLDQVMRCRLGDGWHASSIGLLHWTDGVVGTDDDIHSVRKQNLAFDNFLYAAYEAYGALTLDDNRLAQAAVEDFGYAERKLGQDGIDTFRITMEHSYNTSDCTFMAAASWAASMLYRLTGEQHYADLAAAYADYTLSCQATDGEWAGYFYRDTTRRAIVHYIHQSREQLPMQALVALCQTQPRHPDYARWHDAVARYGSYLKRIMGYTEPYGMAPSGIYQEREYQDEDGFNRLHLWAPRDAHERYDRQLAEGVSVGNGFYVRRFPVWFSIFNGNEAVILSTGKAAALCGKLLGDAKLLDMGREQLYWTLGKNPFCQSLVYGEGYRYPSMDSFSSGEIMGEMPVGIRSMGDADVPYWPMTNNACYKEVWLSSAGKWLSLLAEY